MGAIEDKMKNEVANCDQLVVAGCGPLKWLVRSAPDLKDAPEQMSQQVRFQGRAVFAERPGYEASTVLTHQIVVHELGVRRTDGVFQCAWLWAALVHDAVECVTGDTSYWVKREFPHLKDFESRILEGILGKWGYRYEPEWFRAIKLLDDAAALAEMKVFDLDPNIWSFDDLDPQAELLVEHWIEVPTYLQIDYWLDNVLYWGDAVGVKLDTVDKGEANARD